MVSLRSSSRVRKERTYKPIFSLSTPDGHQVVVTIPGKICRTVDHGHTWSVLQTPHTMTKVRFGKGRLGVAVGPGCIGITRDDGSTWNFSELSKEWNLANIWCGMSGQICVVGQVLSGSGESPEYGLYGESKDEGATWRWTDIPEAEQLEAVQGTEVGDVYLLGSTEAREGVLLNVRDDIRKIVLKVPYELHALWLNENILLAGGLGGRILKGDSPHRVCEWTRLSGEADDEVVSITALKDKYWLIVTDTRAWLVDDNAHRQIIAESELVPFSDCIITKRGTIWLGSVDGSLCEIFLQKGQNGNVEPDSKVVRLPSSWVD